jgi:hypothetical protein
MEQQTIIDAIKLHKLRVGKFPAGVQVDFSGANLRGMDLSGMDLSGADFHGANLKEVNFEGANLESANLSGATLEGANMCYSNLEGADLSKADLHCVDFKGANLRGVSFEGSNVRGIDLRGVELRWDDLHDADVIIMKLSKLVVYVYDDTMRIDCQYHSHKEWMEFSDEDIKNMHPHALSWWKKYKSVVKVAMKSIKTSTK